MSKTIGFRVSDDQYSQLIQKLTEEGWDGSVGMYAKEWMLREVLDRDSINIVDPVHERVLGKLEKLAQQNANEVDIDQESILSEISTNVKYIVEKLPDKIVNKVINELRR